MPEDALEEIKRILREHSNASRDAISDVRDDCKAHGKLLGELKTEMAVLGTKLDDMKERMDRNDRRSTGAGGISGGVVAGLILAAKELFAKGGN